jgi:hypothetical protein
MDAGYLGAGVRGAFYFLTFYGCGGCELRSDGECFNSKDYIL